MKIRDARPGVDATEPTAQRRSEGAVSREPLSRTSNGPLQAFQAAIDGSPRMVAQRQAIGRLLGHGSSGPGNDGRQTVTADALNRPVVQRELDEQLAHGRLHVIGEDHRKTEARRRLEMRLAQAHDLTYMTEPEFDIPNTTQRGDPTPLRILFAMASLRDLINSFDPSASVVDQDKHIEGMRYLIVEVAGDFERHAPAEDAPIRVCFRTLQGHLSARRKEAALAVIQQISQMVRPDQELGDRGALSRDRSLAMHAAAASQHTRPVMWMVGFRHVMDIDAAHPVGRNYLLLDDTVLDDLAGQVDQVNEEKQGGDALTGPIIEEMDDDEEEFKEGGTSGGKTSGAVIEEVD